MIGAAVDRGDAEAIADRPEAEGGRAGTWAPWREEALLTSGPRKWRRDALMADGTTYVSLYQEIVCVPLAGMVTAGDVSPKLAAAIREEAMMRPVVHLKDAEPLHEQIVKEWPTSSAAPPVTRDRMLRAMERIKARPKTPGPLRVGGGAAWDYVQRAIDQSRPMAAHPDLPLPDSVAARVMGVDIVLDRDLPANVIRFGAKNYVVSGDHVLEFNEYLSRFLAPPATNPPE